MTWRAAAWLLVAAGLVDPASAAGQWPCSDPAPDPPAAAWLWDGARYDPGWRSDPAIAALAGEIANRAVPEAQATTRIVDFAAAQKDRPQAMAKLGSALIDTMAAEERTVVDGIGRFNARQAELAQRIEASYAEADKASAGSGGTDLSQSDQTRWDTRIFEDRQRLLPVMCRIPGTLNARLGTLLAVARKAAGVRQGEAGYLVYVSDETAGAISIIDPASQTEVGRIPIGKRPRGLVASPDRRLLYVAVSGSPIAGPDVDEATLPPADKASDGIAIIDLASKAVVRTLRGISDPEQLALSPDGQRIYVASEDAGQLFVLDTAGSAIAKLTVGGQPEGVSVSDDGSVVLATSEEEARVTVIRAADPPQVTATVPVGERPRNVAFLDGHRALVPGEFGASLTLIDFVAARPLRTIALGADDRPMAVRIARDGMAYVTTGRSGKLLRVDPSDKGHSAPILASVRVGVRPWGLALSPDGATAFTANGPGDDVTMVDLATMRVIGKVAVRGGPWGVLAVPTHP